MGVCDDGGPRLLRPAAAHGVVREVRRVPAEEREIGEGRALVRLSMSYQAEGPAEAIGSVAGLDARRIRGDLERFKEFIEERGAETGAWRGEIIHGAPADNASQMRPTSMNP